ncbi:MAG: hypothetical protein Q8P30_00185 [Candidatus Uhrbacteria bacterium]|nr:hypothetical protein [Candidatus Uhrbacteria bacterium]
MQQPSEAEVRAANAARWERESKEHEAQYVTRELEIIEQLTERGNHCRAAALILELIMSGYGDKAKFRQILNEEVGAVMLDDHNVDNVDNVEMLIMLGIERDLIDRKATERLYENSIIALRSTKMVDFGNRSSFYNGEDGEERNQMGMTDCVGGQEILAVMTQTAEFLGRTKDVRTWNIHYADYNASDTECEEYDWDIYRRWNAYHMYVKLGLHKDARGVARSIGDSLVELAYIMPGGSYSPFVGYCTYGTEEIEEAYDKAGLSKVEIQVILDKTHEQCVLELED